MKRYKPWKLIIIMLGINIFSWIITLLAHYLYPDKIILIVAAFIASSILSFIFIMTLFYFVSIYEDKIIFRQGYYFSMKENNVFKNKLSWISNFVCTTLYFSDIKCVKNYNVFLGIYKIDDDILFITFNGYSKKVREEIFNSLK